MTGLVGRACRLISFVLAGALAAPSIAVAQTKNTGELHGTVADQTGGVVVGASVALENDAGEKRIGRTDREGRYAFERLAPGRYTLTIGFPGFLDFTARVDVRQAAMSLDVSLRLGLSVSIEVRERAGLSNDPRKNLSALVLTGKDIAALPDDPRLFVQRLLEMAGSTGRPGDVAVYVDGFRNYKRLPPKNTIEMIRINSNPFSAEFAQPSAKRIEITTRPGSDSFQGDARVQARSSRLDARNPLAEMKPASEYRNYNGYLEGPIRKERVGLLLYGGQWQEDEQAFVHATVLAAATTATRPLASAISTPSRVTSAMLKTDFKLFDQLINASYTWIGERHRNQGLEGGFDLPEHGFDRRLNDEIGRFWWTSVWSRAVNDVRVELTRSVETTSALLGGPAVLVFGAFNGGGNQNAASRTSTVGVQAGESVTIQRSRHTFKTGLQVETIDEVATDRTGFGGSFTFGADVERDRSGLPLLNASRQSIPIAPIENYRRTVLGLPGYGPSQFSIVRGNPDVGVSQWNADWFALDDWSISKRVSLSYGVRHELQNNVTRRMNLAPRASLSWLVDHQGKNAVKLGAGVFYARVDPEITLQTSRLDGTRRQQLVIQRPSFFATIPLSINLGAPVESSVYTKSDDLRVPFSLVTSAAYERQLPAGLFAVVEYHYNRGVHLLRLRNITAPLPGARTTDAPVLQFEATGRSSQQEVMLGLRADVGSRFSLYGNYTLGRKYSDTDGAYTLPANSHDLSAEYGAAGEDQRHSLAAGATVQGPGGLLIIPSLTFSSGRPFNITTGRDNNDDTIFTDRPAFAKPGDAGAIATPFGLFNPNPRPGDAIIPRNYGRESSQVNVALAVSKAVLKSLTVTVDAENLLNTSRLVGSNGVLTSPLFGLSNRALNARRLELTLRCEF